MENRIEYKLMKVVAALTQKEMKDVEEALGTAPTLEEILDYAAENYKAPNPPVEAEVKKAEKAGKASK